MILSSTSDLVKITTSASADIHVQASWADKTSTSLTAGRTNTTFTSATTKTVVGSPGSSTQRSVHSLHIANVHATDPNTVTIKHTDGTTEVTILVVTLASGETLEFDGRKFVKYGASSGGGGGDALTSNPLSQFASTTSAQLRGVLSDETGTGSAVFATSPTLVTPVLGAATATSINKVAITAPATGATFTLADGKTYTVSNTLTLEGTDGATLNIGAGGTLGTAAYTASSSYQAADAGLAAIASLTSAADSFPYFTGSGTAALLVIGSSVRTFLATPSSANLRAALTDETGTGNAVFSTAPTLDSTVTIGTAGGTTGAANFRGTTSGVVTLTVAAAAGTHTIKLPIADGTTGQVLQTDGSGQWSWTSAGGGGVSSVGLSLPAEFSVSGSPVTGSGTLTGAWASQSANLMFASPNGSSGAPSFRSLVIKDIPAILNGLFGDGVDGSLNITTNNATTGALSSGVLTRDLHADDLTMSASARILPAGYRVRVRGTLDITSAPAASITGQGNLGGNSSGAGAGASSSASAGVLIGGGHTGTAGAAGGTGAGAQATVAATSQADFTNVGGSGGAGGASGTGNAGGALRASTNSSPAGPVLKNLMDNFIRGVTFMLGGSGGTGGSAGGGDGTGSGGGGGGGGESGRMVVIYARRINRGGSTAAGVFQSKGGNGGNGGLGSGGTNRGGGGGGGGGSGGVVWICCSELLGSSATNALDVSGGTGGNGGNGTGSGSGGNGGNGGAGGRIYVCQIDTTGTQAWTITTGTSPGTTGGTASGGTGGSGGAGVTTQANL